MSTDTIPAEVAASWSVEWLAESCPSSWDLEAWEARLAAAEGLVRWATAMAVEARAGVLDAHRADGVEAYVAESVALVEECSPRAAEGNLDWSVTLADHLPVTLHLLREGHLPVASARMVAQECAGLSAEQCAVLEQRLWAEGFDTIPSHHGRQRGALQRRVQRLIPAVAVEEKVTQARTGRRVERWAGPPGTDTAVLAAHLTGPDAENVWAALDATAHTGEDTRSLDARRADALVEAITGQGSFALWADSGAQGPMPGAEHWTVAVRVDLDTLVGPGGQVGYLTRTGGITSDTARLVAQAAVAAGGPIARLVTDPLSGVLLDTTGIRSHRSARASVASRIEPHYRPSESLATFVRARDQHCQHPGCTVPAKSCELDHITPYDHAHPERGGQTTAQNLLCLCKRHHLLKHSPGWTLDKHPDGSITWTSPSGRVVRQPAPDARSG